MPQIYCNNHAHAAHAICSSGAECHGHANAPSSTALWPCADEDVATIPIGSDTHKPSRNGDIKRIPRPAGSQADLASAAGPCEAARVTMSSSSWIGVERHQIHLPLLRWTEPVRCHHHVSIGPIQVGFSLPHESHCESKAREKST